MNMSIRMFEDIEKILNICYIENCDEIECKFNEYGFCFQKKCRNKRR